MMSSNLGLNSSLHVRESSVKNGRPRNSKDVRLSLIIVVFLSCALRGYSQAAPSGVLSVTTALPNENADLDYVAKPSLAGASGGSPFLKWRRCGFSPEYSMADKHALIYHIFHH